MRAWIGTSGFQYPEWKGSFYPQDLPAARMLTFYADRFRATEINYSFRRIPSEQALARWTKSTPPDFRFSLKAPQKVTHFAKLQNCEATLNYFADKLTILREKLGPILFQLPPNFRKDKEVLTAFLKMIPSNLRAAFEFRDASWFEPEIFELLGQHNAALCLAENEDFATPQSVTADFGYLRLRREDYNLAKLKAWANFIQSQQRKWEDVFIYFKHEERGIGPEFASKMASLLQ